MAWRHRTIPSIVLQRAQLHPSETAYAAKDGESNGRFRTHTWGAYGEQVRAASRALVALQVKPGDRVCLLGFNSPEWVIFAVAAMAVGAAPAGIYQTSSVSEVAYIVQHTECAVMLVEDAAQLRKVEAAWATGLPDLKRVVLYEKARAAANGERVLSWRAFLDAGERVPAKRVDELVEELKPEQVATLIYTSGTTGPPKGVMLSHASVMFAAMAGVDAFQLGMTDTTLSYLPLSHIAEQMFSIHVPALTGGTVFFAESFEKLPENLREVQPTCFFGVPRVWEKFYQKASQKLAEVQGVRGFMARVARATATRALAAQRAGQRAGVLNWLLYHALSPTVLSKIRHAMGLGRVRVCGTGAAPIDASVLEFFASLGVTIYEVYGQSEGCGPTSWTTPGCVRLGTVGKPVAGASVRIAMDGEVVMRGPNVFLGYFKDDAATHETLRDGWLMTGDLGEFDADGFLRITGRKKDILITAGGKNITPVNIELALKRCPLVCDAVVVGDRRPFLTALVSLDPDALRELAESGDASPPLAPDALFEPGKSEPFDMATMRRIPLLTDAARTHPAVLRALDAHVQAVNAELARVEGVKAFRILPRQLTIAQGELTATLKVKRARVYAAYASVVEGMYGEQ